ncbi:hypothetical protein [Coleofasciculus sp.]|uniref:hypothetical protein n=1 Tax=Coleofasciculus sp. TaxID=3100458 RepID=UPI0039F7DD3E
MTPPPRLHLLIARAAPKILIIRRSPSRVYHFIAWDTATDQFEPGSWFRGKLYVYRCDLSFDGQWLVYFALGPSRELWSWVALSQPPWLRALTLWPKNDSWHGGGVWLNEKRLWLNLPPTAQPRPTDTPPSELGIQIEQSLSHYGEDEGPFYRRLERDGWQRAGDWALGQREKTALGYLFHNDPGWFLQPTPTHPTLRMFYRGYYFNRGRVYAYTLDGYPQLLDAAVEWAGWDQFGRLVVARMGGIERYSLDDLKRGTPSFRYDLKNLTPPPRTPRTSSSTPASSKPPLSPGPDDFGRYPYLGDPSHLCRAVKMAGHLIHSPTDLQAIAPILREDKTWPFEKPQTYIVNLDGVFVLGGRLNEHAETASGEPVLAAGEATLEEQPDGTWHITAINNRSYGYMPTSASWIAVERALTGTGIPYPQDGFTEIYPHEGTWADVLAVLRE